MWELASTLGHNITAHARAAWYCRYAMSTKNVTRTNLEGNARMKFTRDRLVLQLSSCLFACAQLVGCASGVEADDTMTRPGPQPDGGTSEAVTTQADASVEGSSQPETSSTSQAGTTTRPTSGSNAVAPTTSVGISGQTSGNPTNTGETSAPVSTDTDDTVAPTDSDAGATDDTTDTDDTTEPTPEGSGIFVALGHGQRTTVSCDDGETWTHNRFTDEIPLTGTDTDHIPFSMRAASYDSGAFYIAWGWGTASYVERSFDGVNWQGVYGVEDPDERSGDNWVWGLAAGDGKVAMGENRKFYFSPDQGDNWDMVNPGVVAQKVTFGYGDGVFVAVAEGQDQGGPEFLYSDDGRTWTNDVDVPDDCFGGRVTRIPFLDGTFLFAAGSHFCRSSDGGRSWQYAAVPSGRVVTSTHDGSRFLSLTDGAVLYASTDAKDWQQVGKLPGSGSRFGLAASSTTGTIVAARNNVFYRSDDGGASFEELAQSAYTDEGGPIVQIEFGAVEASEACR